MSEPMRCRCDHCATQDGTVPMLADQEGHMAPEGEYILQADYARLKAEHEKEELKLWDDNRTLSIENARLKAEVERLRKAGDVMAQELIYFVGDYDPTGADSLRNWLAAKEGKQP